MPSNINNLNTSQTITSTQFQTSPSKSNIQENAAAQTGILGKSETNRNMTISYGNNKTRKPIGPKPNYPAPKPQKRTHESQETSRLNESPKLNLTDASEPSENKTNNQLEEPNTTLVNALNKITGSLKYKITLRSSKRRQMVLNALNQETQKTINSSTLNSILGDKNCSRGVKTALLLSDKVSLAQKQTILKNNSVEILAYAKAHEILDQVAYYSVGGMMSNTSMTKTEALTTAVFDKNGKFDISHCEEGLKTFFNPTMFTTEERKTIEGQLEKKKIKNPQTDADKFNNFKIDATILMFNDDNIEKKCEEFNKIFNNIMSEIKNFAKDLPETMDDDTRDKINEMKNYCEGIAKTINTFHLKAPEDSALNNLWNMNGGQGATRISMPLNAISERRIGDDISGAKQETLKRAQKQPIIQKAKYEVCKYYDELSEDEKKLFGGNNKNYAFDTTGLELTRLCHKETGKIDTSPKEEINVFNLNDTAMHQVATTLGLLNEHEKFNIDNYFIKYGQKPILIDGKEVTAQQIIDIVKNGKDNETKLTITQVKRNENGNPIVSNGKQVTEQVEKTLAELIQ